MRRSPILLHEHDEYIDRAVFIEGCNVYLTIIRALSSQESGEIDKLWKAKKKLIAVALGLHIICIIFSQRKLVKKNEKKQEQEIG